MAAFSVLLLLVSAFPVAAYPQRGRVEHVSKSADGVGGDSGSLLPSLSADGRYVAFFSSASNLVPNDPNTSSDVFVYDRGTLTIERASVMSDGTEGPPSAAGHTSTWPSISADGRYVAFESEAALVPDDTNDARDVYVRDREGATERVSISSEGAEASRSSKLPDISADGRHVVFSSYADLTGDGEGGGIFVHDRATRRTARASDDFSWNVKISGNGRYVAYDQFGSDGGVFVFDRQTGATERASVAPDGTPANGSSYRPSISADGRYVAFHSSATNLVPTDGNTEVFDAYVKDRTTGAVERVSVTSWGGQSNRGAGEARISADGRYVAFSSSSSNLVEGDRNVCPGPTGSEGPCRDIFVHDRHFGTTRRVSVVNHGPNRPPETEPGDEADDRSELPIISADGRHVAYTSFASNLVLGLAPRCKSPGGDIQCADVFVSDVGPSTGSYNVRAEERGAKVRISGWASFDGASLTSATDDPTDGAPDAESLGAEITAAEISVRPEEEDLFLRMHLSDIPSTGEITDSVDDDALRFGGRPGVLYGFSFTTAGERYEVRGLVHRKPIKEREDGFELLGTWWALYRCDAICQEVDQLEGSIGSTGRDARVSLPLQLLEAGDGIDLRDIRAFTAIGEAAGGLEELDEVALPDGAVPAPAVTLGIAARGTPQGDVVFDTPTILAEGFFIGTVDGSSLPASDAKDAEVWMRACLGEVCGVESRPVSLAHEPSPSPDPAELGVELTCVDCPVEIRAGDSGTATMVVSNVGDVDDTYAVTVDGLPDDWAATADPDEVPVAAGEDADVDVTVQVPRRARAGTYTFTVTATSVEHPDVRASEEVVIEVRKGRRSGAGPPGGDRGRADGHGQDAEVRMATAASSSDGPAVPTAAVLALAAILLSAATVRRRLTRRAALRRR